MQPAEGCVDNVILTGIPRSGTTLACALLNRLPDTLALNEPMDIGSLAACETRAQRVAYAESFFAEQRKSALCSGEVLARIHRALLDENTFHEAAGSDGLRHARISLQKIRHGKTLNHRFTLVVKHPNALTAILADLAPHFPCFAIIRDPISVLASWNTLAIPLRDGHAPAAENLDDSLSYKLGQLRDPVARQIILLDWYFEQYSTLLPSDKVIRYEEIVASGGAALAAITPAAEALSVDLENRNGLQNCTPKFISKVRCSLERLGIWWRHFYPGALV